MKNMLFGIPRGMTGQPQVCQCLMSPTIEGSDYLKSGTIEQSPTSTRSVHGVGLELFIRTPRFELLDLDSGLYWWISPDCLSLAMDDLLFIVLCVNFVVHMVVIRP